MSTDYNPAPASLAPASSASRAMYWVGWVLTVLPSLMLFMSGGMKLSGSDEVKKGFQEFGYPESVAVPLGVVEIGSTILYLIPQTSVLGAILLTGYLGGATATHVRASQPFIIPVVMGVVIWFGLFFRDKRIRDIVPLKR